MSHATQGLLQRIEEGTARTVVIGLGYVGLPFALLHAQTGFRVTGIEHNPRRCDAINRGESYIEEVASADLAPLVEAGQLRATPDFEAVAGADVVSICVPTPIYEDKVPDVSAIRFVLEGSRPYFRPGQLVVLESTTYPGTTEEILVPSLRECGLTPGVDVFVAFAPERIDPGNRAYTLRDIARVVGGVTPACSEVAATFYRRLIDAEVRVVSTPAVAEMTKLLENVFRVVNVSLMNELAQLSDRMGVDIWEAVSAASTKPFGYMPFFPGPGVGGHCIPVDPFYLSWKAREFGFDTRFIELAGEINDSQPAYVVERVESLLAASGAALAGARILLLGMAFKKNVADTRDSASLHVARHLLTRGADVRYHDPHVPTVRIEGELASVPLTHEEIAAADCVVILTDHDAVDYASVIASARLVYDTRNATPRGLPHVHHLGAPKR